MTVDGGCGTLRGVATAPADSGPVPIALRAETENVCTTPFWRPVIRHVVTVTVHVAPPGDAVTV
ncbi:unannotated protein [freshwater metagenome]|uniref:Unannotated protein n=1 Tax=freshwater metagenome TaxID=449393 RepID=A0A6J6FD71_9ZZZZ